MFYFSVHTFLVGVSLFIIWNLHVTLQKLQAFNASQAEELRLWKEVKILSIDLFETDKLNSDYDVKQTKLESAVESAVKVRKLNEFMLEQLVKEGILTVKQNENSSLKGNTSN